MLRRLPPLNAVRAFEAAARNGSVTRAARELSVTQGAVSRHVRALEQWLGAQLFERTQRGITLTAAGHGLLSRAARRARPDRPRDAPAAAKSRTRTCCGSSCRRRSRSAGWCRASRASTRCIRRIDVQITTSHERADFDREDIDACIHSEREPPPGPGSGAWSAKCCCRCAARACSSAARRSRSPRTSRTTCCCARSTAPTTGRRGSRAAGVPHIDGNSGLKFENAALAYQAAIDELGVMIAQRALVEDDLAAGRLVAPIALAACARPAATTSRIRRTGRPPRASRRSRNGSCARRQSAEAA